MTAAPRLQSVLTDACRDADLDAREARLLHEHSNTVYLLPRERAVARISHNDHRGLDARASVTITKWLADQGVPVTVPLLDRVFDIGGDTVTFWQYYPQDDGRDLPPAPELASILRALHTIPQETMPFELPHYRPLQGLIQILSAPQASRTLDSDDRHWLMEQADARVAAYTALDSHLGRGPVHGDAYRGNTLWGPAGRVVLGDWDEISLAPRELDLINTYQSVRFGGTDSTDLDAFARAYGWDVREWDGYASLRTMRDLHTLTGYIRRAPNSPAAAHELQRRIRSLRNPAFADTLWCAIS